MHLPGDATGVDRETMHSPKNGNISFKQLVVEDEPSSLSTLIHNVFVANVHVIVVLWVSRVYGYCTALGNTIIPHEGYNPYTLESHSTADLYHD